MTPYDTPLDGGTGRNSSSARTWRAIQTRLPNTAVRSNYKMALLQRLANPLIAYDPTINPYITVDWQAIDLNGVQR